MTRACTVPGCKSRHHSHGFCSGHRHRWKQYGDPTAGPEPVATVEMTRTCTVPGCQSRHHSHGFCSTHRHRWKQYGDPTAGQGAAETVKAHHVDDMLRLAAKGLCRSDIAAITGWSVHTVGKHIGHIVPRRDQDQAPDLARYHRMIKAAESAEYGTSDQIARRFGLKNARTLWVTLVKARRLVAADREAAEKAA